MTDSYISAFDSAISPIADLIPALSQVPDEIKEKAEEISLRCDKMIIIRTNGEISIMQKTIDSKLISECTNALCTKSINTFGKDAANGFITLHGGHRVGLSGTAVYDDVGLQTVKNITSINIRIARECFGTAQSLLSLFGKENVCRGLLILGRPSSGKTTLLRDLCRSIGGAFSVSLIDERQEIAVVYDSELCYDVGLRTDIFNGYKHSDGIICAMQGMSPDYIVLDDIENDADAVKLLCNCPTGVIATASAYGIDDYNDNIRTLIESGTISHIAFVDKHNVVSIQNVQKAENDIFPDHF